jgi:NAD(P)H dehydrogenase (quinone)
MNILFVYAHEDPKSFGSALHNRALSYLEHHQHRVAVSDLYASGFHPVAAKWDFVTSGGSNKNYMLEQKRATLEHSGGFAEDIKDEVAKVRSADLIIFEFPLWWSAPPAMMKGWFDKVFAMGVAWDSSHRYKEGFFRGKQALVVTSAGDPEDFYSSSGIHRASVTQHLYPLLHSTIAHAGIDVIKPFIVHNLTAASDQDCTESLELFEKYLETVIDNPEFIYKH